MRQLATYAFTNAKVRAMLSYLIEAAVFSRLLEAKNLYELIEELKNTPYRDMFSSVDPGDVDLLFLERELLIKDIAVHKKVYDSVSGAAEKEFVGLLTERYEIDELKTALRLWHSKEPVNIAEYIPVERIAHDIDFGKIVSSQVFEEIIVLLDKTPYKEPLLRSREKFKETNSLFYPEASLDVDYYNRLNRAIERFSAVDRKAAARILGAQIDGENIQWLIKMRKYYSLALSDMLDYFIPGGSSINKNNLRNYYSPNGAAKIIEAVALGPYLPIKDMAEENMHLIQSFLYEVLLKEVRRALSGFPFTIGTILGYLVLKRAETKNIVSLLYAKSYGWKKEDIVHLLNM